MLRGKSPCQWAESASRRLQDFGFDMCNDAASRAAMKSWSLLHHHSHVVSARFRAPTERGSLSLCLPFEAEIQQDIIHRSSLGGLLQCSNW
mmetsp:Transcript_20891/g.39222  ORF Transcript_20891/g.39222 Transcript_20891/m.39222 type:complete len:91 (-) Transcript_20891:300-572(-)